MSKKSDIEWTDASWNPVRGCVKVSPGCKHCYAETFAERWRGVKGHAYEQGFDVRVVPSKLWEPLKWRGHPRRIFVNSMSDLFQDGVPFEYVAACFGVMAAASMHTFQILTKRADRMREFMSWIVEQDAQLGNVDFTPGRLHACAEALRYELLHHALGDTGPLHTKWAADPAGAWPLDHVLLGVSVEDRRYGVPRIDELRATPAALRFLSIEPLLEDLGDVDLAGIGWVIIGGESGPRARECSIAWIRRVVEQCREQGVPVFVKQLGAAPVFDDGRALHTLSRKGGDMKSWPRDLQVREFPEVTR